MKIDLQRFISDTAFIWKPYVQKFHTLDRPTEIVVTETSDERVLIKEPFVSIVILTYNHGTMLEECVHSVLMQQTEYSFEIIIANDLSTDATTDICFRLQREYPEKIRILNGNANVGSIRNAVRGIQRCRGKYIACIDGDDFYLSPFKIQKQVSYLESHPEASMSWSSFYQQLETHKSTRVPLRRKTKDHLCALNSMPGQDRANVILYRNTLVPVSAFFTSDSGRYAAEQISELFKLVEWFPCQDFELWYYISHKGQIHFLPEELCVYRINSTSASNDRQQQVAYARMFGDQCDKLAILQDAPPFITEKTKDDMENEAIRLLIQNVEILHYQEKLSAYLISLIVDFAKNKRHTAITKGKVQLKWEHLKTRFRMSFLGYLVRKWLIAVLDI